MFSLGQYRAFVAVAETQSVTNAAQQLGRTPSAISMMVAQLEDRLGAALFDGGRKARLTDLGNYVYAEAKALLDHDERVARSIRSFAGGQIGLVEIACIPSISNLFLPGTLCALWKDNPSMTFNVSDMDSKSVVAAVSKDRCEIGVGIAVDIGQDMAFTPLFDDPIDVVFSSNDSLSKKKGKLDWSDLSGRRFLGNSSYSLLSAPQLKDLVRNQAAYIPNITSLLAIVRDGDGITLLPRINNLHAGKGVSFRSLKDKTARRQVGFITKACRSISPGGRSFLSALRAQIDKKSEYVEITVI